VLVSISVGFLYYLLEWYLCENVCVSHEPNLMGNVKWSMSVKTEYSMDAVPYQRALWSDGGPEAWMVYSRNTRDLFSLSKAGPSGLQEMKVSWTPSSKSILKARCSSSMSFLSLVLLCPSPGDRIRWSPMHSRIL